MLVCAAAWCRPLGTALACIALEGAGAFPFAIVVERHWRSTCQASWTAIRHTSFPRLPPPQPCRSAASSAPWYRRWSAQQPRCRCALSFTPPCRPPTRPPAAAAAPAAALVQPQAWSLYSWRRPLHSCLGWAACRPTSCCARRCLTSCCCLRWTWQCTMAGRAPRRRCCWRVGGLAGEVVLRRWGSADGLWLTAGRACPPSLGLCGSAAEQCAAPPVISTAHPCHFLFRQACPGHPLRAILGPTLLVSHTKPSVSFCTLSMYDTDAQLHLLRCNAHLLFLSSAGLTWWRGVAWARRAGSQVCSTAG